MIDRFPISELYQEMVGANMEKLFGSIKFTHVCEIVPEMDENGSILTFLPQTHYKKREQQVLHAYGAGPFCRFRIPKNLPKVGVYILTVDNEPFYVGECDQLSRRYNIGYGQISPRNCYQGGQPTNCRLNNLIYQTTTAGQRVDLWFLETSDRFNIERVLIQTLNTRLRWNRKN